MSDPRSRQEAKQALRKALRRRLEDWTVEASGLAGAAVVERFDASETPAGLRSAPAFVAFASLKGEIATGPLLDWCWRTERPVFLPRMNEQRLDFVPVAPGQALSRGRFGVREPGAQRAPERVPAGAVVFVPGLAFDRLGGRLGRGAGYYDRALSALRSESAETIFVGLAGALQIVPEVPMEAFDVRMQGVLTDEEWIWPSGKDGRQEFGTQ